MMENDKKPFVAQAITWVAAAMAFAFGGAAMGAGLLIVLVWCTLHAVMRIALLFVVASISIWLATKLTALPERELWLFRDYTLFAWITGEFLFVGKALFNLLLKGELPRGLQNKPNTAD